MCVMVCNLLCERFSSLNSINYNHQRSQLRLQPPPIGPKKKGKKLQKSESQLPARSGLSLICQKSVEVHFDQFSRKFTECDIKNESEITRKLVRKITVLHVNFIAGFSLLTEVA